MVIRVDVVIEDAAFAGQGNGKGFAAGLFLQHREHISLVVSISMISYQ